MTQKSRLGLFTAVAVALTLVLAPVLHAKVQAKVDLNTASDKELEALKGVGAATAKKIIENRPYASVDDLSKAGLTAKKIAEIKPFVTVSSAAAAAPAAAPASAPASSAAASAASAARPVDINSADAKALEALPGVGAKTADEIIKGRPYKTVDDLAKVKGIGKAKLDKLRPLVTVGSSAPETHPSAAGAAAAAAGPGVAPERTVAAPRTASSAPHPAAPKLAPGEKVNINTASKEKLDALPGIGPVKAQAILDARPFAKIEDVMRVKGIKQGEFSKIKDLIIVK
jgi:competence protein ComEA